MKYSNVLFLFLFFVCGDGLSAPIDSVVKIYTVISTPSYVAPWTDNPSVEAMGTGCVIRGKRILTNAHVVSDQTMVMVRKQSLPDKYRARVHIVSHECDLALLTVDDETFFQDLVALELKATLPELQEAVSVVGYPEGGDTLSYSQGIVSRLEVNQYTHSGAMLLAMQIDAAVNPGNSGGPVISADGKLAGVVMQYAAASQSVGYAVPIPVIQQFMKDLEDDGKINGLGYLDIGVQCMESPALRASKGMASNQTGVLVISVIPAITNAIPLRVGDVLMAVDGVAVANDGTIPLRKGERVNWSYGATRKLVGESCALTILRDGKAMEVGVRLVPPAQIVPAWQYDTPPSYFIHGGLVFVPLTGNYLSSYGTSAQWPQQFLVECCRRVANTRDEQVVVLHQVLPDDCNIGYGDYVRCMIVRKVNQEPVVNLKDLKAKISANKEKHLTIEGDQGRMVVLDAAEARAAAERVLKNYRIPAGESKGLDR